MSDYTKTIALSDNVTMIAYCRCIRCGEYGMEIDEEIETIKLFINDAIEVELSGEIDDCLLEKISSIDEIDGCGEPTGEDQFQLLGVDDDSLR